MKYPRFWTDFAEAGVARACAMLIYSHVNCALSKPARLGLDETSSFLDRH